MKVKINKSAIEIVQGDIAAQTVDAIVNAANDHLWMGGGVAGAIKRAGGVAIETEAMRRGPLAIGAAVATGAGALPAKRVVHAAVMGQDLQTNAASIRSATRAALECAERERCASVAFPALGTGVGGFPMRECAAIMLDETIGFFQSPRGIALVRFVLFDAGAERAFTDQLKHLFTARKPR